MVIATTLSFCRRRFAVSAVSMFIALFGALPITFAQTGGGETAQAPAEATPEALFVDFLHFARMGRFTLADAYAKNLLAHPDLDPVKLVEVADRDKNSVRTLLIIIKNSSIGENAARVLDLLQQGEHARAKSADRIVLYIDQLGGDPQQEFFAIKHLVEAGEYAVPHLVQALLDPGKKDLWPRIIYALPKIGKSAVNPLVMALLVRNNDVRLNLIHALGEIGYPQSIAYLRRLIADESMPRETKDASEVAIARIEQISGRIFPGPAEELFVQLAESYYDEQDGVRADPRLDEANVWYWDESAQSLTRVSVPQRIFGQIMAMRCAEESLRLRNDGAGAIALWLAANIRRESRLGLDVESGDPDAEGETDPTRPDVFPRALYFAQAAGPRYAHLVLERAVGDNDSDVALGAIEALRVTAGETSLVGAEDFKQPLVRALLFPDPVVRTRAALALGAALPKSEFSGSELVAPVLASALGQTGQEQVLVVDVDQANLNRVVGLLRNSDRNAIGHASFYQAIERARLEFQTLAGLFIATDITDPPLNDALQRLRGEFILSKLPIVVMTKPRQSLMASEIAANDPYVETVSASADDDALLGAFDRVRARTGQAPLDPELALSMALHAGETLRRIAVDGRTNFDLRPAEPALIGALSSAHEPLQILAASVLALLPAPTAQRAIAHVAIDDGNTDSLRIAAFGSLAESAKNHGNQLEDHQITSLVLIADEDDDMTIRTAASRALGAVNLATSKASEIIRGYYGG